MSDPTPNRSSRRDVLKGIGGLAAGSALAGCASVVGKPESNTLRYAQVLPPISLDPIVVDDPWSMQATAPVFEGLYTYDYGMNLVPVLAKGKPEVGDGGRRYTVRLKEGPRFQNDDAVRAEDVKYSFEAPAENSTPTRWNVEPIAEIRTKGKREVEFRLEHPYGGFEHALTRDVVPKGEREDDPVAFGRSEPVGSGPYRVQIFKPGKYVVLTAWKDYWGDVDPAIEKVKMLPNHAGLSRVMSLKTGQNDVVERVQPRLWTATRKMPNARVASTGSYHSHFVAFNCSDYPLNHAKAREAVDYVLDMDEFVERVVGRAGERQYGPLPRRVAEAWDMPVEEWKDVPHGRDTEEAKLLFDEAGVDAWTPLVAVPGTKSSGDLVREKLAEEIVAGLKEAGFSRARTEKIPWPAFRREVTSGNSSVYDAYVGSWAGNPDPDSFVYPLFADDMEGLTNGTYYRNDDLTETIRRARESGDRGERKRLYERAIDTVLTERVHLPAYTLDNSFGVKDRITGFRPHPVSGLNPRLVGPNGQLVETGGRKPE